MDSVRENHRHQTRNFHKTRKEGQWEVTTRVQKGASRGMHLPKHTTHSQVTPLALLRVHFEKSDTSPRNNQTKKPYAATDAG